MNIKTRILLFVLFLEISGYTILVLYSNEYSKEALMGIRNQQISAIFYGNLGKINSLTSIMEKNVEDIAVTGERFWSIKQNNPDIDLVAEIKQFLINNFSYFTQSIGGGIWYDPYIWDKTQRFFGPYVYRENQRVVFTWDLNTPQYDYHNQSWYIQALPAKWDRAAKRQKRFYWTIPYYDEAGSMALMITVDAFMYDNKKRIIGITTVDWALKEVTDFIEKVKLTTNTFPFLIDKQSQKFVSYPKDDSLLMQNIAKLPWTSTLLSSGKGVIGQKETKIDGITYIIYHSESDIGLIFGLMIPKNEMFMEIKEISEKNLLNSILISMIFISIMIVLLHILFMPFNKVLIMIGNSVSRNRANNELTITYLQYNKKNEFYNIVNTLNDVYKQVDRYTSEINDANKQLAGKQSEIAQLNKKLQTRIVELKTEKQRAEVANETKSIFLATMSHELRTPLNAIIGYSELILEELSDMDQNWCVADIYKIKAAGSHLLSIISEILDLSKIEAGQMALNNEEFHIGMMVEDLMETVRPLAARNHNVLNSTIDDSSGLVNSDQLKMWQCVFNVLNNACKFTQDGHVYLDVTKHFINNMDWVRFTVRDTGIGINVKAQQKLFEPFVQADSSTTRKYGGTGLGLAITDRLCKMLQGEISFKSKEGEGSTFIIQFPKALPEALPEALNAAEQ